MSTVDTNALTHADRTWMAAQLRGLISLIEDETTVAVYEGNRDVMDGLVDDLLAAHGALAKVEGRDTYPSVPGRRLRRVDRQLEIHRGRFSSRGPAPSLFCHRHGDTLSRPAACERHLHNVHCNAWAG